MFFPIYIIPGFAHDKESMKTVFPDGKTRMLGCFCTMGFLVKKLPEENATVIDIEFNNPNPKAFLDAVIDGYTEIKGYGNGLNLFMQYRHEVFWAFDIRKENVINHEENIARIRLALDGQVIVKSIAGG
jgi:hypothetical protein